MIITMLAMGIIMGITVEIYAQREPEQYYLKRSNKMTEYFEMSLTFDDLKMVKEVVNRGIDSRLEGFTVSIFHHEVVNGVLRLQCQIYPAEMQILIRRLLELETEQAEMLADDIVRIYYDEEII